jgi:flagellar biosynthetic protein FliO
MEWLIVKTALSLGAVLALMLVLVVLLKKYVYQGKKRSRVSVEIEVLGQRMLQPRRSVYAIKVMNKVIVVGVTEHGMNTLTELSDPVVIAEVEERQEEQATSGTWAAWLGGQGSRTAHPFAVHLQRALGAWSLRRHQASAEKEL